MVKLEINAKLKDEPGKEANPTFTATYEFGANLQELAQQLGDEVVYSNAIDSLVISAQSLMRRMIRKNKTPAEIQEAIAKWKPTVSTTVRKAPAEKVADLAARMSKEEKEALIKKLKEELKAA